MEKFEKKERKWHEKVEKIKDDDVGGGVDGSALGNPGDGKRSTWSFFLPKAWPGYRLESGDCGGLYHLEWKLPVGLRASRSNILGSDRKVMSGKYVDCVVAIDLPSDEEFYNLQVYLVTDSASDQLIARVDAKRDFASSEVISAYTIADLQLDDDRTN